MNKLKMLSNTDLKEKTVDESLNLLCVLNLLCQGLRKLYSIDSLSFFIYVKRFNWYYPNIYLLVATRKIKNPKQKEKQMPFNSVAVFWLKSIMFAVLCSLKRSANTDVSLLKPARDHMQVFALPAPHDSIMLIKLLFTPVLF